MLTLLGAVGIVLLASAISSGVEAALFSVPIIKVQQMAQSKKPATLALLNVRQNMSRPIATIVVLNNVSNIVGSIIVGGIATTVLGSRWLGLFSGILTFLVIIFAEIIPKTLGERYAEKISLLAVRPLVAVTRVMTPVIWCIEKITLPITKSNRIGFTTNEEEIKLLTKIGQKEGVIEQRESRLIQRAFELNDIIAADLMTPRVEMTYLNGHAILCSVQEEIISSPHSRIIVIGATPDDVTGVVLKDELLAAIIAGKSELSISSFKHNVRFVDESERADKLLSIFQESRQHLVVVLDEYAGVSGVVTLEDVLEILTGEIVDETDRAVDLQEVARIRRRKYDDSIE